VPSGKWNLEGLPNPGNAEPDQQYFCFLPDDKDEISLRRRRIYRWDHPGFAVPLFAAEAQSMNIHHLELFYNKSPNVRSFAQS